MCVMPPLSGKYVEKGERPFGPRQFLFTDSRIRDIQVGLGERVGAATTLLLPSSVFAL